MIRDILSEMLLDPPPPYRQLHLAQRDRDWLLDYHDHDFYQILYCTDGMVEVSTRDESFLLTPGCAIVLPPFESHMQRSPEGYTQIGMDINRIYDERGIYALLLGAVARASMYRIILPGVDMPSLFRDVKNLSAYTRLRFAHLMDEIVLACVEAARRDSDSPFKRGFIAMLAGCDNYSITLAQMSEAMNMSVTHLERLTRREFGMSAMAYVDKLRLAKACALMRGYRYTVAEIADFLGFYDVSHFYKFFKKGMGVTPSQFRGNDRRGRGEQR